MKNWTKHIVIACCCFLLLNNINTNAQGDYEATEYELMALFISHFPKYITFPTTESSSGIRVTILGDSPLLTSLKKIEAKSAGKIKLNRITSLDDMGPTEILVIGEDYSNNMIEVMQATKPYNIMIVSHSRGMEKKGSCLNFFVQDGRVKFKISKKAISGNDLKISAQLLKLATIVE